MEKRVFRRWPAAYLGMGLAIEVGEEEKGVKF